MTTESDIQKLYSIKDNSEFKERVVEVLYDLIGRIRDLEDDIAIIEMRRYQ